MDERRWERIPTADSTQSRSLYAPVHEHSTVTNRVVQLQRGLFYNEKSGVFNIGDLKSKFGLIRSDHHSN